MLSFPSTLNKGGSRINTPQNTNSLKDVLNNSMKSAFNAAISKATSGQGYDTDGIRYDEDRDRNYLIDKFDFTSEANVTHESNLLSQPTTEGIKVWSPLKMNEALFSVVNNYRGYMDNVLIETGNDGEVKNSNGKYYKTHNFKGKVTPSLFNPYHALPYRGIVENVPLLDGTNPVSSQLKMAEYENLEDCSINELVRLSSMKDSILGQARYKYSDFMYCKDLGKISNNHLITLRKFSTPIGDNIFRGAVADKKDPNAQMGDVGRLIAWFDTDDNKLSDILNYEYQATWKQLNSKISQQNSQEEDEGRGLVGKFINNMSAGYNAQTAEGKTSTGGILGTIMKSLGLVDSMGTYADNDVALGRNYDNNKVYEPKDTIQDTHIYEGKLIFKHEFNLTFSYRLRAYDNINPKSAFLDLLGNILSVTYRKGTFWGGRNEILGAKPNRGGWAKYNSIMNGISSAGGDLWSNLFHLDGATSDSILGSFSNFINTIGQVTGIGAIYDKAKEYIGDVVSGNKTMSEVGSDLSGAAKNMAQTVKDKNLGRAAFGMMMNKLGRPALYAFDSLLTGANVGLWHVTIGNPKNPIVSFGNLIMTGCKITHSGPLGLDDFPTELTVSVSLKHARSRDAAEIGKMYTKGRNNLYMSLCSPFTNVQFSDGSTAGSQISGNSKQVSDSDVQKELSKAEVKEKTNKKEDTKEKKKFESDIDRSSLVSSTTSDELNKIDNKVKPQSEEQIAVNKELANRGNYVSDTTGDEDISLLNSQYKDPETTDPDKGKSATKLLEELRNDRTFMNQNQVNYSRWALCGSDMQEYIANKDELR